MRNVKTSCECKIVSPPPKKPQKTATDVHMNNSATFINGSVQSDAFTAISENIHDHLEKLKQTGPKKKKKKTKQTRWRRQGGQGGGRKGVSGGQVGSRGLRGREGSAGRCWGPRGAWLVWTFRRLQSSVFLFPSGFKCLLSPLGTCPSKKPGPALRPVA